MGAQFLTHTFEYDRVGGGDAYVFLVRSRGYLGPNTFINLPFADVITARFTFRIFV